MAFTPTQYRWTFGIIVGLILLYFIFRKQINNFLGFSSADNSRLAPNVCGGALCNGICVSGTCVGNSTGSKDKQLTCKEVTDICQDFSEAGGDGFACLKNGLKNCTNTSSRIVFPVRNTIVTPVGGNGPGVPGGIGVGNPVG